MDKTNISAGEAGRSRFSFKSLSITKKVAAGIIAINFLGLLAMGLFTSQMSISMQTETAVRNWSKDAVSIATQASGGVKWGHLESIQDAYQIFRDDAKLALDGFSAFNKQGEQVDSWIREGIEATGAVRSIIAKKARFDAEGVSVLQQGNLIVVSAPLPLDKDGVSLGQVRTVWTTGNISAAATTFALQSIGFQAVILLGSVVILLFILRMFVGKPLSNLNERILGLQAGDYDSAVPHADSGDEVGVIAQALTGFCGAAKAKQQSDIDMERQRAELEGERHANSKAGEETMRRQRTVVDELGKALERLAVGDLTVRVPQLGNDFQKLCDDFNAAVSALSQSIMTIDEAQRSVSDSSGSLEQSSDELSRRTEQQAASLEQTAAALDEITATVQAASAKAAEAGDLVGSTRDSANRSGRVVKDAIDAMSRIEQSSSKIAQILKVIDEIAFQTNLLALNAGVEAARAGDAGKGFAVVAQEVRDLAGRSATAAKEIKELIEASDKEVRSGVSLVNETGEVITVIEKNVGDVAAKIEDISTSAREQATGISQINSAVNEMDQMTQQNAAMVQESHHASKGLAAECARLAEIVKGFKVSGSSAMPSARPAPEMRQPARRVPLVAGNTALAIDQESWEEF